jgi:CheY-like chemotaxis protein
MSDARAIRHHIVVAEDYPDISQLVGDLLRDEGYQVEVVANGSEVIEAVLRNHPCLLLLDLSLPDVPGNEVLRQLTQNPDTSDVPVVIVSAYTEHLQTAPMVRAVVNKPFDIGTLLETVAEVCRAPDCWG